MTQTLRTPTDDQWRWLCEKAGLQVLDKGPYPYIDDFSNNRPFYIDDLPHNTDALMRLMDAVSTSMWSPIFERWRDESRSLMMKLESPKKMFEHYDNEYRDPVVAFQAAACDILHQLAVAEGWE